MGGWFGCCLVGICCRVVFMFCIFWCVICWCGLGCLLSCCVSILVVSCFVWCRVNDVGYLCLGGRVNNVIGVIC